MGKRNLNNALKCYHGRKEGHMNPLEALQVVLGAAYQAPMPKQLHIQVEQAGKILRDHLVGCLQEPKRVPGAPVPPKTKTKARRPKE